MNRLSIYSALLLAVISPLPLFGGNATFDFNTDPFGILDLRGDAAWRETGGIGNSGYLSITDATNSLRGVIVFDDFDDGALVKAFTFSCELRTGGGTTTPADGYSVSFAREDDPIIQNGGTSGFAASPTDEADLPEEGTTTGISIGLDEYFSGGTDVIGISVRVDNELVHQTSLPTLNGAASDTNSLQTGPAERPLDEEFNVPDHAFVNLTIKLDEDGTLDVTYKGRVILENFQTSYFPSAGRIVFAGRTGASNAHHHVDNIVITTIAASTPSLTGLQMGPTEMRATITDGASSVLDTTKPLTVKVDGNTYPATATKEGSISTVVTTVAPPNFFANGSHLVEIAAADTNNNQFTLTREVTTEAYTEILPAWKAATGQVNLSQPGFKVWTHQLPYARHPGDANVLPLPEQQLYHGFYDSGLGGLASNVAELGSEPDGTFGIGTVLNWSESAGDGGIGNFTTEESPIPGIPGSTGSTDNIVSEVFAWLELPAGAHTLGVNSDDGFTVSFGSNSLDHFERARAGEFNGGRGASDTTFTIAVSETGFYPVRLLWWEGGGGANLEFFSVLPNGTKVLINDVATEGHLKAYRAGPPATPAIHRLSPYPSTTDNDPRHPVTIELVDGVAAVNSASIKLSINETEVSPTVTSNAGVTTIRYSPPSGVWPSNSTQKVKLEFTDANANLRSETWEFSIPPYQSLTLADGVPASQVSVPGFTAKIYQVASKSGAASGVDTVNWNEVADDILAGAYGENVADLSGATEDGLFLIDGVINWSQNAELVGNFQTEPYAEQDIPGIPGTTGSTDNIAGEIKTWLVFPQPGVYLMGVNSDDGFRAVLGHDAPTRNLLEVTGSATISGPLPSVNGTRSFGSIGAPLTSTIEAAVVLAEPLLANTPLTNAAAVAGKIVYIDRGDVTFATKLRYAAQAGAVAAIIGTNNEGYPIVMGVDATIPEADLSIPAVMTSQEAGNSIKAALAAGEALRASLGYDASRRFAEFNGDRGSSDTNFFVHIVDAGAYPFRVTWKEGGGGANIEWFSFGPQYSRVLINDETVTEAIRAYQTVSEIPATTSIPVLTYSVDRAAGSFSLTWSSQIGATYKLETTKTLAAGEWQPVATGIASGGNETTFSGSQATIPQLPNLATEEKIFFRISRE